MGGETPDRSALSPEAESQEQVNVRRRRLAMVRLAVGGPTFMILIFGLVLAYRIARRPLGDGVFWAVLGTLAVGFGLYAAVVLAALWKSRRP